MTTLEDIARHRMEANEEQLKKDIISFVQEVASMRDGMTDDNIIETIAPQLVSKLTGSSVSEIIKSYERYKEARYYVDIVSSCIND